MLNFIKQRLAKSGVAVIAVILAGILVTYIDILCVLCYKVFIDRVLDAGQYRWLNYIVIIVLLLVMLQCIASLISIYYSYRLKGKTLTAGAVSYIYHLLHLPLAYFDNSSDGDLLNKYTNNEEVSQELMSQFMPLIINTLLGVLYLLAMVRIHKFLAFFSITVLVVNLYLSGLLFRKLQRATAEELKLKGELQGYTVEGMRNIERIKADGAERYYFSKWCGIQQRIQLVETKSRNRSMFVLSVIGLIEQLMNTSVLLAGAMFILRGDITLGTFTAFQGMLLNAIAPMDSLQDCGREFQQTDEKIKRVQQVYREKPDAIEASQLAIATESDDAPRLSGEIEMNHVTFSYQGQNQPALRDVTIRAHKGECIAFVGESGSGKSTALKLLCGLYTPQSGQILYDGTDIDAIPRNLFTSSIGTVDQRIVLFNDTVQNNITLWNPAIDDDKVIEAASDACIHTEILQKEQGYRYVIHGNGIGFSGGQRQRIEIARALAKEPSMLFLDEATAALDARTEKSVMEAVRKRGITTILVAHRLSTIRDCDVIYLFEQGRIIAQGTHNELLKTSDRYRQMIANH